LAKKRQVIKCRVWIYQLYEEKAKKVVAEFTKKKEELMKKYEQETQKLKDAINNSESAAKDYKQAKKDYDVRALEVTLTIRRKLQRSLKRQKLNLLLMNEKM